MKIPKTNIVDIYKFWSKLILSLCSVHSVSRKIINDNNFSSLSFKYFICCVFSGWERGEKEKYILF